MNLHFVKRASFWLIASLILSGLMIDSLPDFFSSWFIAVFMLVGAFVLKFGLNWSLGYDGPKRYLRIILSAIGSLYVCYLSITGAYWYMLELRGGYFDKVLLNPIFLFIVLGFFLLVEYLLFKRNERPKSGHTPETITIISNRKETVLEINEIAFVESCADYTIVRLKNGESFKTSLTISSWEQNLPQFLRIHRSFLVSTNFAIKHGNSIKIQGYGELPISRTYKTSVNSYFNNDNDGI